MKIFPVQNGLAGNRNVLFNMHALDRNIFDFIKIRLFIEHLLEFKKMTHIRFDQNESTVFLKDPSYFIFGDRGKDGYHLINAFIEQGTAEDRTQNIESILVVSGSDLEAWFCQIDADFMPADKIFGVVSCAARQIS